jgi:hypothetical protein
MFAAPTAIFITISTMIFIILKALPETPSSSQSAIRQRRQARIRARALPGVQGGQVWDMTRAEKRAYIKYGTVPSRFTRQDLAKGYLT